MAIEEINEATIAVHRLTYAQKVASELFEAIEKSNLIVQGKSESQVNMEIEKLALEKFGIERHWHKKIVRCGENTMSMYGDNPPDQIIQADDIVFIDYGIVVDGWEADFARTYVLGSDERKIRLKNDVEKAGKKHGNGSTRKLSCLLPMYSDSHGKRPANMAGHLRAK